MSTEEIEEFEVDGGESRSSTGFCLPRCQNLKLGFLYRWNLETIGVRQIANDRDKQDMERQRYNNYNKIQTATNTMDCKTN